MKPSSLFFRLPLSWAYAAALLCAIALASGCASRSPAPPLTEPSTDAAWAALLAAGEEAAAFGPAYYLRASMHLIGPEQKSRVVGVFRGNFFGTCRLDVSAGVGALAVIWRETPQSALVYFPMQNKAVAAADPSAMTISMGLPAPFSLNETAQVLYSRWDALLPDRYDDAYVDGEGNVVFAFAWKGRRCTLQLDEDGHPLLLSGPSGWTLRVLARDMYPRGPSMPERLRLTGLDGQEALLYVKHREMHKAPWPDSSMKLQLPPNTALQQLKQTSPQTLWQ